jgi:hypothetical protein
MANEEHLSILRQGVQTWNQWRGANPELKLDLREANLSGAQLYRAHLSRADLSQADLTRANLTQADLTRADLSQVNLFQANLTETNLPQANLSGANLCQANLFMANLFMANLSQADLTGADLVSASLVKTNLEKAKLTNCLIYGVSAWQLKLEGAEQSNLVITPPEEPTITVDDLEVAQFISLLLHNEKIRRVIDTITSKVVLILGRFTPERKAVLDAIREELRRCNSTLAILSRQEDRMFLRIDALVPSSCSRRRHPMPALPEAIILVLAPCA